MKQAMSEQQPQIAWEFDPSPPSGARTGGNVAEYAFRPDVSTLVREVNQNILDNPRAGGTSVSVAFHLIHLKGNDLSSFLKALRWSELASHVDAAGRELPGKRFRQGKEKLESDHSLQLLVVEDGNTTGLTGAEDGDGSNFAQLCRDTLYSNKASESAGGSYGLGKAVLWLFSSFSTVIFNSQLEADDGPNQSPRFIGRAELPWHKINSRAYAGSGWLGEVISGEVGKWARSIWAPHSARLAKPLYLARDNGSGTSILVVGFRNPADEDQDLRSTAEEMIDAVSRNFWPSVIGARLQASVAVTDPSKKDPIFPQRSVVESDVNPAFAECLTEYSRFRTLDTLAIPGEIAHVPIAVQIPARSDGSQPQMAAEVSLVVRLADESEMEDVNEVAFFRGTGMVVKYERYDRLSLSQRPFHAILVCGKARRDSDESDVALDEFLRAAEPPEHKSWEVTARLKETYKPGYKRLLLEIDTKVREALRDLVSERPPSGTEGPRLLMKLFPIGSTKGVPPKGDFRIKDLKATFDQGVWAFSGSILALGEKPQPWTATIDLRYQGDDPTDSLSAVVKELHVVLSPPSKASVVKIESGVGYVAVPKGVTKLRFEGSTDASSCPIDPRRATVVAEIHCAVAEKG